MYRFVGRLMGAAIQSAESVVLNFPPFIWKKIAHYPCTVADYAHVRCPPPLRHPHAAWIPKPRARILCIDTYPPSRAQAQQPRAYVFEPRGRSLARQKQCGHDCDWRDRQGIDVGMKHVDALKKCPSEEDWTDSYEDVFQFETLLTSGKTVELKPGGSDIEVTFDTRIEFVEASIHARMSEM